MCIFEFNKMLFIEKEVSKKCMGLTLFTIDV
jgi:hypothetical protein